MLDPHSLAAYSSHLLNSPTGADAELEKRLGLYRVFLKLYEHHRNLLDEILDLENFSSQSANRGAFQYVQGVVQGQHAYLMTNLSNGKTQTIQQSQMVWTIGRNRRLALPIPDKRLSRLHAVIQYIQDRGFYLIDLNSTNGSFVNGEQVRHCVLLQDGDRIRLGSLAFTFFVCQQVQTAAPISTELLDQLNSPVRSVNPRPEEDEDAVPAQIDWDTKLQTGLDDTSMFLRPSGEPEELLASPPLDASQQADILDRFMKHQSPGRSNN